MQQNIKIEGEKKRGRKVNPDAPISKGYFGEVQEQAIRDYLYGNLSPEEKNKLFKDIIDPCFRRLVSGVMRMPMFQKMIGVNLEQLQEDTYYHLIFQMEKFDPDKLSEKTDEPVKAYSYLGTVVRNYVLGIKILADKQIAKHGGMLDVDELSEVVKQPTTGLNTSEETLDQLRESIIERLDEILKMKTMNKNDLIVGATLRYMLLNWHKLEFKKKNEFIRLLCNYTQLNSAIVARSLKKFRLFIYDSMF